MESLNDIVSSINGVLWSSVIIVLLVGAGVYFTIRTKAVQLRYFGTMFKLIANTAGTKTEGNEISPFQAFCVSTASRVGVGNIAGIAIAIVSGGPGAIFWMWFIAVIGSATGFVESTLAQIYKVPREDGNGFRGGPAYYLKNGLGHKLWAAIFAILISVTYGMIYNSVQSNTISLALNHALGADRMVVGAVVTVLAMAVICGGMGRIARVTEWMVPLMAGLYIVIALGIMIYNITDMPHVFYIIFRDAFDWQAAFGGGMGAAVLTGFKRGLFSNEAGSGSAPCAAAAAACDDPVKMGFVQALGVLIDTVVICSCTAFLMMLVPQDLTAGLSGMDLLQTAMQYHLGGFGTVFIAATLALFSFSTFLGVLYYARGNVAYLSGDNWWSQTVYKLIALVMLLIGGLQAYTVVWDLGDVGIGLMTIFNMIALYPLSGEAMDALNDYEKRKKLQ